MGVANRKVPVIIFAREIPMRRAFGCLLLLLAVGLFGCSKAEDPNAKSIPNIPPGRGSVGPDQGEKMPVAPPGR